MGSVVHVEPVNDLIAHEDSDGCPCLPVVEPVPCEDGSMGWLIVHNSWDGRENHETDRPAKGRAARAWLVVQRVRRVARVARRLLHGRPPA